jgi:nicotinate-nucleotide adenylyltransferase
MLRLALESEPDSVLSEVELEPSGPRYTVETLGVLQKAYPGESLTFIMGLDSLLDLPEWREPERIVSRHEVIVIDRPGFAPQDMDPRWMARIRMVTGNPLAISSSGIRNRVASGLSIRHLVPPRVDAYIAERGLYRRSRNRTG